jgi:RNA polymerase sigma-70 factor (ECF subfamily)
MDASDLERLAQLVSERAAGLTLFARQWLDAQSAEDAVQEALVALLCERRPPDNPVAWMYRTVRNAAIDAARGNVRRRQREQVAAQARNTWFESRTQALLDARVSEHALRQLPAEYREIVVMRIWGDLGFAEIAEVMQLSVSTVHGRYTSAIKQLRFALEKSCKNQTD